MKTINSLLTGLLIVPFMVGCGSSDALKDYKDVKGTAPTGAKPTVQNALSTNTDRYFTLTVLGPDAVNFVNIEQGKPADIRFKVTINHPQITGYDVQLGEFPQADAPVLEKNADGTYSLKWTPQMGTVTNGEPKQFKTPIQVFAIAASDAALTKALSTFNIIIEVKGTSAQPTIVSRSQLETIEEGVESKLEVIVDDPGATSNNIATPEIVITSFPYTNKEAYRADGRPYVFQDSVEKISATKFKFNLTVYAQSLPLGRDRLGHEIPNSQTVPVCFYMRALGVTERLSGAKEVCVTGKYAAQPPAMNYADGTPAEIKAGVETALTFTVVGSNPSAQVSAKSLQKQIAVLKGTKSADCASQNGSNMTCVIKWKPLCVKEPLKVSLSVSGEATLNGKVKSSTLTKEFTVTPNPEACPAAGGR